MACRQPKPKLSEEKRKIRSIELSVYHKEYRQKNKDKIRVVKKEGVLKVKLEGIAHYGGKCSCCGESIPEFLTMEHINGRDKEVKKVTGKKAWQQVKAAGWPTDITLVCFNCNCAKGAFGICPHQQKKICE